MSKTLFLIRHAKSSWDSPGLRDFDRPLNARGLREAPLMAQQLAEQGIKPDLLVSSPAKRALTTALFFAGTLTIPEADVRREAGIYEADPTEILRLVSALPATAQTVLFFGHNPTFTMVANHFSDRFIDNVPTCGIVQIETDAQHWDEMHEGNSRVVRTYFPKETLL